MGRYRLKLGVAATVVLAMAATSACGSSSKSTTPTTAASGSATTASGNSSGNTASAPGVTPTTITLGVQTSLTGSASSEFVGVIKGIQARLGLQNADGGVFGRQVKFVTRDDQSTESGSETAAQSLASAGVFGVMGVSAFVIGGYRTYLADGIPVTGGGFDGPEWEQKPDTNMFAVTGEYPGYPQWTTVAQFIKSNGGTNVACLGYNVTSSLAGAVGCAKAAKAVGLKAGYLNDSIAFGTVAVSPIALAMKSTGVDAAETIMDANTNLAILTAAKQEGVDLKVPILATGYGQDLLDDPSAVQAAQGAYLENQTEPVELHTPATEQLVNALKTYANYTGIPGFDYTQGWLAADLMIKGLEVAGKNPTRKSFIANLSKVTNYDANGLLSNPVNFSKFGQVPATACYYFPQLVGHAFVTKGTKPVCGTLIPS
jgi:branched-chain amino acid transport system substrate-binding protein